MSQGTRRIEDELVLEREHWVDGPPHELAPRVGRF